MTPHTDAAPLGVERTSPDLAAVEARAATYERAGWDVTASGPGAEGRATVTRCDAAAHASAADVPALLAHVRRLTAALADSDARVASAVAAERARCAAVCRARAEKRRKEADGEEAAAEYGEALESQVLAREADALANALAAPGAGE